ncbi:hypothetical protein EHI8A_137190 [Entamoeba histolytica HM-1:IMSS-B]|uniref:TLDc domain-containing protein n=6 Tax=Entamoeba histolytica TaxID=5759 RepID=C4M2V3_ENTH1|nr:hypothetical protein EHI_188860 [Entamoeba histolytica HM-1:IMSS]EMD46575.1 Hypothetical protein EHI5A_162980 [Entamoeba histolytica KU27]EMH72619.1 hypothetical protein EHI8A_137190 [Entamoeba histolytica HM-1:IMSS-B]EMS15859.1 hypothetical protein KM1_201560 [Entamoeba histolytica HM-3:IMSS]ENY65740.1 hypothetical protein EHI7A_128090 [Entamoeba histolytica HM-1:IMSS-A]GAT95624.1 hypothetical protein CL6EHI_188860 [Entamoeba histolytica]|eukprot:XP_656661.1 hypothetical protein EHI_188860 [Entamoeba histolytica HM-1:IMSS]
MGNHQSIKTNSPTKGSLSKPSDCLNGYEPICVSLERLTPNKLTVEPVDTHTQTSNLSKEKKLKHLSEWKEFRHMRRFSQTFQENKRPTSAPLEPNNQGIEEFHKQSPFEDLNTQLVIKCLKKTTQTTDFEVIYDSLLQELDSRNIKSAIEYKTKILFIFETKSGVVGFYQEDMIPMLQFNKTNIVSSNNMWVFTVNKNSSTSVFQRNTESKSSFSLYCNDSHVVLNCYCAFWMNDMGLIQFNPLMKSSYTQGNSTVTPLQFQFNCTKIQCERLCILQCKD